MLRIMYSDKGTAHTWKLCGQLAGPWVEELRSCWQNLGRSAPPDGMIVDLREVTFVDEAGEQLLSEMCIANVEFITSGVETNDLVENLNCAGRRQLRRTFGRIDRK